jgi:hypothetical protein
MNENDGDEIIKRLIMGDAIAERDRLKRLMEEDPINSHAYASAYVDADRKVMIYEARILLREAAEYMDEESLKALEESIKNFRLTPEK